VPNKPHQPLRLDSNLSGIAHLIEMIQHYNELSAATVVQAQLKLRAFLAARAILVICHLVLVSIGEVDYSHDVVEDPVACESVISALLSWML